MADDAGFKTVLATFLRRNWVEGKWFREPFPELTQEEFGDLVEEISNGSASSCIASMLRSFHDLHGRYPEYEEIFPPDGPKMSLHLDIK